MAYQSIISNDFKFDIIMEQLKQKTEIITVNNYLDKLPDDIYLPIENIRQIIKFLVPGVDEIVSGNILTYRYNGMLVGLGLDNNQCSFFLMSSTIIKDLEKDLEGFDTLNDIILFTPEKPIPNDLITRIVMARMAENELKRISKKKK